MTMVARRRYCSCTSHGFLLLVPMFVLFLFYDTYVAVATDAPPSLSLDKNQRDIMRKLSSMLGNRWNTTLDPCEWRGVVVCSSSGSDSSLVITNLTLRSLGISSSAVFDFICPLNSVQILDLSKNSISSLPNQSFPSPCAMSARLQQLNLSSNLLSGSLPNFSVFSELEILDLSSNNFSGKVNTNFISLPKLRSLNLSSNNLEGDVPLPTSMPLVLQELVLSGNEFVGQIPTDLFRYLNLTMLDLSQNNLAGEVHNDFRKLEKLQTLLLSSNSLSGPIPESLSTLKNLSRFQANQNNFIGLVPSGITKNVKMLDLSYNRLNGTIPFNFFSPLGLESVDLTQNQLEGQITGNISRNLYRLRLGSNLLNRSIPDAIGDALALTYLELDNNSFEGIVPAQLGNCKNLTLLNLANNSLEGSLPSEIGNLKKLEVLKLQNNNLNGSIPVFSTPTNLGILNLSQNLFIGKIPPNLFLLANLTNVNLQGNKISGEIPSSISSLKSLIELNIANNDLIGSIPGMPASLSTALNLSHNNLNGSIPPNFELLKELEILDLSYNNLSGQVPYALTTLHSLTLLVLSYNQFSGRLPPFGSYVSVISDGNLDLTNVTQDNTYAPASRRRYTHLIIILALAGTLIGLIVLASVAVYSYSKRIYLVKDEGVLDENISQIIKGHRTITNKRTSAIKLMKRKQDEWRITPFQDLDYEDVAIPQELKEENLIGRGGSGNVYRVTYTNRYNNCIGTVAIKQIRNAQRLDEKLEHEFESEANILGNIRHNNIVKLQCCVSSDKSMLLVYDYMDNGSLHNWLHDHVLFAGHPMASVWSVPCAPLDWPTRLRVAVGAAQGLYYVHHECSPPIIHRDVKTSNILLDSDFRAKVADFGLARMLVQAGEPETMSAVAGSCGYMAPEYAYTTKVNEKVDVYSFGVVLLELTTGKKANDGGEHGCLVQWAWHHYQLGENIPDTTDKFIRYTGYPGEIETIFRLGIQCTRNMPSSRPTMRDVLRILLKCSQKTDQKNREERAMEHEAAPLFLPQRGSRRRWFSSGKVIIEEMSDFHCTNGILMNSLDSDRQAQ